MKEFIGRKIVIGVDGGTRFTGEMIADFQDRLVIGMSSNGDKSHTNVVTVIKSKLTYFGIEENISIEELKKTGSASSVVPLTVLACHNKSISCPGVRFVAEKRENKIEKSDFEKFMSQCPVRQEGCKCSIVGNFINADPEVMINTFGELLIGEYPNESNIKPRKGKI